MYSVNFSGLYTVLMVGIHFFPLCFGIFLFFCDSFPHVSLERDQSYFFFYAIIFLLLHNGCSLIHVANQIENHNIQNSKIFKYEEYDAQKAKNYSGCQSRQVARMFLQGGRWQMKTTKQWASVKFWKKKVYVLGTFDHGELVSVLGFQNQK